VLTSIADSRKRSLNTSISALFWRTDCVPYEYPHRTNLRVYDVLSIFFEAFPIVFGEVHGFNLGEVGISFLGILVGAVFIGTPLYFIWKWKYQPKHFDKDFNMAPELQLPSACVSALCLPISLFWFG
jgi:hypothetical protein